MLKKQLINTAAVLCLSAFSIVAPAQRPAFDDTQFANGFASKISGTDFTYHSSIPIAKESLLIRATDGQSSMEWKTEPVPADLQKGNITFVWLAGIGSSPGLARFDLEVNGNHAFSFWTDGADQWTKTKEDGSSLHFEKDMIDEHGDRFGFMYLTMPVEQLETGEPLHLKITGGAFSKTSWVMTFAFPLKTGLSFRAFPAIVQGSEGYKQLGTAGLLHFGPPETARIYIEDNLVKETEAVFGYNYLNVHLPFVSEETDVSYFLEMGDFSDRGTLTLSPVREWQVNFVQHTHTDIGYTRPQTEILGEHLRFIDYALDYCDMTDDYPEEAQFRWTCEAAWAVEEYLRSRPPNQVDRLVQRVDEGRIEITGMYFNFDELPDEQILAASLQALKKIREHGIEVKTAMQNDVNGIGWCLNEFYHDLGIPYLNMGTHGHRALICFDKPTLFWWESPSGKRMLAYRAEHYMTGNTEFRIHTGDFNRFETELLTYLTDLENKGYEYDLVSIQHSGFLTDNAAPSTIASDMIRQWNEKYVWPQLRTSTATAFFEAMEADHGDSFEVIRGAWPDWWTDGFGASAREVAATRTAQGDIIAHVAGLTMAAIQGEPLPPGIHNRIESTNEALLFYTEHTVGYHASVSDPFHKYTMEQRAIKESYAWESSRRAKMLGEEGLGLLQNAFVREEHPSLIVFNPLNWKRSGMFVTYVDHQTIPRFTGFRIVDGDGNTAAAQPLEYHSDGTYWAIWADDIPAFGYKTFTIRHDDSPAPVSRRMEGPGPATFGNQWYQITVDTTRAAISSIVDKETGLEVVDQEAEWMMGEFIYELLDNRAQLEAFKLDNYTREPLEKAWFDGFFEGDVWNTLRFRGNTRASWRDGSYVFEIRLFNTAKRIDFAYHIDKKMVTDPEAIYISFPVVLESGQIAFDVQGGEIRAGIDQIPGSANDWNTIQNYVRIYNDDAQLIVCPPNAPLMQLGGINTGRYQAGAAPESTHIYGWPMNNYWTTNFNAEQHGGITWDYSFTSTLGNSATEANRFGWSNRVPFLARVIPGGGDGDNPQEGAYIDNWPENILLVSAMPEKGGQSAILHVREVAGTAASFNPVNGQNGDGFETVQVDVLGNEVVNGDNGLMPYETKFFRVSF